MMNASPAPQEIFLLKLGEVVLKGQNRQSFEDKLLANVRRRVKNCGSFQCSLRQSTIYVEPQGEDCDMEAALDVESLVQKALADETWVRVKSTDPARI